MKLKWIAGLSLAAGVGWLGLWQAAAPSAQAEQPKAVAKPLVEFTAEGKAKQPVGYRKWVYIGTPVTPNELNDGEANFPEFHNTYMDPEGFAHVEQTGEYRDGTVIVKEMTAVGSKEQTSGKGYFQGDFTGLEISVKDSKRFPNEPGNWAYFSYGHRYPLKAEASKNAAASCNSCHEQNATNFVFSDVYPVLKDALAKAKAKKK